MESKPKWELLQVQKKTSYEQYIYLNIVIPVVSAF
jgi:hypothetical protein